MSLLILNVVVAVIRYFVKYVSAYCHIFEKLFKYIPKLMYSYYIKVTNFNHNIMLQISLFFI
jgi:hypothetical protein